MVGTSFIGYSGLCGLMHRTGGVGGVGGERCAIFKRGKGGGNIQLGGAEALQDWVCICKAKEKLVAIPKGCVNKLCNEHRLSVSGEK